MAQYPTSPAPSYPYSLDIVHKTIVSAFDSGKEQRRQKQLFPKYDVNLIYDAITISEIDDLWSFYTARKGSFEAFYFYTLEKATWTNLFMGTGDGMTLNFDIPGKETESRVIYLDGVEEINRIFLVGGGNEDSDRVSFSMSPSLNQVITCDFYGYMRIRCRFTDDKMTKSMFTTRLCSTGLKLKGLTGI